MQSTHIFTLKARSRISANFVQESIKVMPEALNGTPVDIAITDIRRIQRVEDRHWAPPKLKYFVFELYDDSQLAGKPLESTCYIKSPILKQCKIKFANIVTIEPVQQAPLLKET